MISAPESPVALLVVPADAERMIVREVHRLLSAGRRIDLDRADEVGPRGRSPHGAPHLSLGAPTAADMERPRGRRSGTTLATC